MPSQEGSYYSREIAWNQTAESRWDGARLPIHPSPEERLKVELYDRLMKASDAAHWGKCPGASEALKREASGVFTDLQSRHVIPPYPELKWVGLIQVGVLRDEAVSLMLDCSKKARELGWRDLEGRIIELIEPDTTPVKRAAPSVPTAAERKEETPERPTLPKEEPGFLGGLAQGLHACFSACGRALRAVARWAFGE